MTSNSPALIILRLSMRRHLVCRCSVSGGFFNIAAECGSDEQAEMTAARMTGRQAKGGRDIVVRFSDNKWYVGQAIDDGAHALLCTCKSQNMAAEIAGQST